MLEIKNLTKKYGKMLAVEDVSFTIPDGQVGILLGPNGAGKSTIIKSIAGLLKFQGTVLIQQIPSREIDAKKIFAYVPEMPAMFEALTVREHLEYICKAYDVSDSEHYMEELLERFELTDKQDKLGNELSKGMMQKVSICCALMIKPKVILFDEPMVGLDPKAIKELKETIQELKNNNITVLVSTHMLDMVKDLWDIMFIMNKGKIVGEYLKKDTNDKDIDDIFFEITGGEA
ncbi:ABC transporter ATP-binding protein [Candidatus Galacturonibacter soehngenii]|uniref:ABC transporter ATP-binding protein n=1 Tax=Candidatus Galacturonatibacter soehngenii TaxID=2307010 RepID=A0A7V7QMN2_9FIRM|nr:ABC transporter ATP-binding protein [Candidatus Galacturonibacter soehngenii]KAB1439944.1 ABC transporter ATP-binding protein [Candidatus Galacturonibacter soehngenii]